MSGSAHPPVSPIPAPLAVPSGAYLVGTSVALMAFHRMPDMEGPEHDRHAHDYRIDVIVERSELDERGMVCDLGVLSTALRDVAERLEGLDLETVIPAEGVTVEMLAGFIHRALAQAIRVAGGEALTVRAWESAVAFGGFRGPVA